MLKPRLVGVDYGSRRVGIAVTDPLRLFARPLGTFTPDKSVEAIRELVRQDGVEAIIVGWPLTLEGEEGMATAAVQPYVNRLKNAFPGVEIVRWDERYSSEMARESIRVAGAKKKARREKARVDAAAAAIILQDYLDAHM